jgi:hypothetical protein
MLTLCIVREIASGVYLYKRYRLGGFPSVVVGMKKKYK